MEQHDDLGAAVKESELFGDNARNRWGASLGSSGGRMHALFKDNDFACLPYIRE